MRTVSGRARPGREHKSPMQTWDIGLFRILGRGGLDRIASYEAVLPDGASLLGVSQLPRRAGGV